MPPAAGKGHTPGGSAELWTLAYPVIIATLSQSIMGMVDTFFMGRVGTAEQGAVGLSVVIFWTVISFFVGTEQGVSTFAAQHLGAGKLTLCGRDGWLGLYLALPSALLLAGAAFFSRDLFEVLGSDEEILPHATDYMYVRLLGSLPVLVNVGLIAFLRGIGDTKTPMFLTVGVNVLNAFLNYALVLGNLGAPRMGATGAALASVIATAVASVAYLLVFFSGKRNRKYSTRRLELPRINDISDFLKIGAPIGGSWVLEMISWTWFMWIVSRLGTVPLAATNIVFQVLHFSFQGAIALATAATTLVGQYLGADDPETAIKTARTAIRSGVLYCVSVGSILLLARYPITSLFNQDPEVIAVGGRLFVYAAVFQFFDGLGISSTGVIRGAGDTRWPMVLMVLLAWGVFAPLTWLLTFTAGLGVDGAWTAVVVFICLLGMGLYVRLKSGKWVAMRI